MAEYGKTPQYGGQPAPEEGPEEIGAYDQFCTDQNAHDRVGRWAAQSGGDSNAPIPVPQGESATAEDGEIRSVDISKLEGVKES